MAMVDATSQMQLWRWPSFPVLGGTVVSSKILPQFTIKTTGPVNT